jgi:hypothetical protein
LSINQLQIRDATGAVIATTHPANFNFLYDDGDA